MRLTGWFTVLAAVLAPAMAGAIEFPYEATVAVESAWVRSGAGAKYYVSQSLPRGATVEVYRHDPGGWLGIRPPAGAFSWVEEDMLEPAEGNLAIVKSDRALSRVGAEDVDTRDEIGVKLNRDEVVEILDTVTISDRDGQRRWCKIAPPSGEFRWISRRDVQVAHTQDRTVVSSPPEKRAGDVVRIASSEEPAGNENATSSRGDLASSSRSAKPKAPEAPDGWRSAGLSNTGIVSPRRPTLSFNEEVDHLEHLLSNVVVQDVSKWDFRQLRADSEALLATADTAADRGRVRIIQGKFDRFEEIRKRHETIASFKGKIDSGEQTLAGLRDAKDADRVAVRERFDGKGVLTPLTTVKQSDPKFALLDASGRVQCYVQAAPGVNMSGYVGREVGVNGSLGFLAEKKAQLLTAKRVELIPGAETIAQKNAGGARR